MSELLYINRDNIINLQLNDNGIAQSLASVTKIDAKIGSTLITNDVPTDWPIKWSGLTTGEVRFRLGPVLPSTLAGRAKLWLIVYDASNTNGIVWGCVDVIINNI
jgi:hypothetical protein